MTPKSIALIAFNVALVAGAITLVALDKIAWPTAEAFIVGQLMPSIWSAFKTGEKDKEEAKE